MARSCGLLLALSSILALACTDAPVGVVDPGSVGLRPAGGPPAGTEYHPFHPSQALSCPLTDGAIARIPRGNGDGVVTDDEVGPGGWRHSPLGRGFVTLNFLWDGTTYVVHSGRSNSGANAGVPDDYPEFLDAGPFIRPRLLRVFDRNRGEVRFTGIPDLLEIGGPDAGWMPVSLRFVGLDGGDRIYEGCGMRQVIATGDDSTVHEGGELLIEIHIKAWARADADFRVLEWEFTQINLSKNVDPAGS